MAKVVLITGAAKGIGRAITVAIAPGYTDIVWEKSSHIWKAAIYLQMKRFAQPEDSASGVLYLASDAVSYMTGTTLTIDGGATLPVVACNDFIDE